MTKILTLLSFLLLFGANAQEGHKIKVNIKGAPEGTNVYLAQYFGYSQPLKKDSAIVKNGEMLFQGPAALPSGMYLIVLNKERYYEIVINEQNFEINSDTTDFISNFTTTSNENRAFYELQRFMAEKSKEANELQMEAAVKTDQVSRALSKRKMDDIQREIKVYKNKFLTDNAGLLVSKYIKTTMEVELSPELYKAAKTKLDSSNLFYVYRSKFWDNYDFNEEAMVRSPFLQKAIDTYLDKMTVTQADSLIASAEVIMKKAASNPEIFRYSLWYISQRYENSKIVGLEPVFLHMAENYYLKGKATWFDSAMVANLAKRVKTMKPLQIGKKFPMLQGIDPSNKNIDVNAITADYTCVVFYADDCGHCREAMPKIVAKKDSLYKAYGLKFVLVDVKYNIEDWKKFINDFKVNDMINIYDGKGLYFFQDDFDVFTTPTTYILDKEKKIIVKKLPLEDIDGYMKFWLAKRKS